MNIRKLAVAVSAACMTLPAASVAQGASEPQVVIEPEALEVARAIMDVMYPPAEREAIFVGMMTDMMEPVKNGVLANPIFDEPGIKAVLDEYFAGYLQRTLPAIQEHFPALIDATAQAYAREFTPAELRDIHAFAKTSTGAHYFRKVTDLMGDPAVASATQEFMTVIAQRQAEEKKIIAGMITRYFEENPEVLERFRKEQSSAD